MYIYVVSNFCLSLYLHVAVVWESPGKMFLEYWKVLEIFLNKRVGTLVIQWYWPRYAAAETASDPHQTLTSDTFVLRWRRYWTSTTRHSRTNRFWYSTVAKTYSSTGTDCVSYFTSKCRRLRRSQRLPFHRSVVSYLHRGYVWNKTYFDTRNTFCGTCICPMRAVSNRIIQTRVCQVQRLLLTTSLYLSLFLKYLTCSFNDLQLGLFKVIQEQRSWCQSEAHMVISYLTSVVSNMYLSRYSRYLMWKFCDLYLGRFKVIQGQRSWCQSIAHGWFPIRLILTPSSYLSPVLKYLTCNFDDLEPAQFKVIQGQIIWQIHFFGNCDRLFVLFSGKLCLVA